MIKCFKQKYGLFQTKTIPKNRPHLSEKYPKFATTTGNDVCLEPLCHRADDVYLTGFQKRLK